MLLTDIVVGMHRLVPGADWEVSWQSGLAENEWPAGFKATGRFPDGLVLSTVFESAREKRAEGFEAFMAYLDKRAMRLVERWVPMRMP